MSSLIKSLNTQVNQAPIVKANEVKEKIIHAHKHTSDFKKHQLLNLLNKDMNFQYISRNKTFENMNKNYLNNNKKHK